MKLIGDMHTHTIASTHAYSTILENAQAAERKGLKVIAMTDHCETMPDSPYFWHFENMKCLPRKISNVTVLRGVEANIIDTEGHLDMQESLLKKMEWVVASMHKYCFEPKDAERNNTAYINIAKNPYVDVIGHCTTATFPCDFERCIKAFKEYGKLVEINESSIMCKAGSRDNSVALIKLCKQYEVPIVIDTDAHFCELVGEASIALQMAEEIGFPEKLIVNCNYDQICERVLAKHPDIKMDI